MISKKITFVDFNGVERTETFHFNLNKSELVRMEMGVKGGMTEMMQRIVDAQDAPALIATFEELICKSFGVKTPDGRGFMKRPEDLEAFKATGAYDELFMELISDANAASEFFNGVIPSGLAEEVAKAEKNKLTAPTN